MRAMVLDAPGRAARERPSCRSPSPGPGQVLLRVRACGVCRTDLHVVDGELPDPKLPLVPGHQIVGEVEARRDGRGERVGVPWLGWTCGDVPLLPERPREPLRRARASPATTSTAATPSCAVADERFCFPLPDGLPRPPGGAAALRRADRLPRAAAGRRRASGSGSTASARRRTSSPRSRAAQGRRVFAFTRPGDDGGAGVRARRSAPSGPGGSDERAAGGARRGDHLRARRASSSPRRCARVAQGRHRRLRRHPHERHPVVPLRAALGRARRALGRQPDARGRRGVPRARARGCRCGPRSRRSRSTQANEALGRLRRGDVRGAAVLVP